MLHRNLSLTKTGKQKLTESKEIFEPQNRLLRSGFSELEQNERPEMGTKIAPQGAQVLDPSGCVGIRACLSR